MKVVFRGIKWDTDGEQVHNLPRDYVIEVENMKQAMQVMEFDISNHLSDEYGFCVESIKEIAIKMEDEV